MKKCFFTEKGPKAVGPYSTAVAHDDTVYLSGMTPLDPATGKLVEGGVEAEARQVFENIRVVLDEMNLTFENVVKTTVFLIDMGDFQKVNAIYAEYFGPNFPARSCIAVSKLPVNAAVEVELICTNA